MWLENWYSTKRFGIFKNGGGGKSDSRISSPPLALGPAFRNFRNGSFFLDVKLQQAKTQLGSYRRKRLGQLKSKKALKIREKSRNKTGGRGQEKSNFSQMNGYELSPILGGEERKMGGN